MSQLRPRNVLCRCLSVLVVLLTVLSDSRLYGQQTAYELPHKRFEYKYSFKGPYLAQKDGTVPFWTYDGNAIASEEMVRITPSLRSKKGSVWTKTKTSFEWWEVELVFRVNGRGRLGADGLAFWFTEDHMPEGPVFGSADNWKGLALFFDSFDNDNKGNNPFIMAMINDGSKAYDHQSDGINQQLAGCLRDFRNKPFPTRAKIEYYKNVLSVMFHSGNTNNDEEYELCLRTENVFLPQFGHFGVSAATGGLADDHDVLKFLTYSLHVPGSQPQPAAGMAESEKERFAREYEQYRDKLERQKEEYFKQHPEEAKKLEHDRSTADEDDFGTRELKQIFEGQSQVFEAVRHMNRKLDEIVGRQERVLSMLSSVQTGTAPVATGQQYTGGAPQLPLSRHEVEAMLGNQREVVQTSRELKSLLMQNSHQSGGGSAPSGGGTDAQNNQVIQQLLNEVREGVNVIKREVGSLAVKVDTRASASVGCPPVPTCLSTTSFLVIMSLHLVILLGYHLYRASRESQAKKFY